MKVIPFKYLKPGDEFVPVWVPPKYRELCVKVKPTKHGTAKLIENENVGLFIREEESVLVDDEFDSSRYIMDELNRLITWLNKRFNSAEEFEIYIREMK